ncbi:MAG: 3-dehydroquinate synthase [Kiritimatiellaeota bacterium]|nr:3-dehydroquinate synthase [Kiritimatiellota bacterium]
MQKTISNHFKVAFDYPVIFTDDAFAPDNPALGEIIGERHNCAFVDSGVAATNPHIITAVSRFDSDPVIIPGGAPAKNDESVIRNILERLASARLDRHGHVLAIGGGSVLDAVGFAAAMFHRGVRLVRMPTTVLAQADAGIGVKNGVDFLGQKNLLGAFAPPHAVINDRGIVRTLPREEKIAGLSECVKVGVIRDAEFFAWMEAAAPRLRECEPDALAHATECAARIHLRQITEGGDPFERGSARPLDFGHWAAHRIEVMSGKRVGHGAAVAVGMALDTIYANLAGLLPAADCERILALLRALGLPLRLPELERVDELLGGLEDFREHLGGELCITLPTAIGKTVEVNTMDETLIRKTMKTPHYFQQ